MCLSRVELFSKNFHNNILFLILLKIATAANEIDGEGIRAVLEASVTPTDTDATVAIGDMSRGGSPIPDEHQKQSSDTDVGQEAGQMEADDEVEAGMIDGGMDTEVDVDPVG